MHLDASGNLYDQRDLHLNQHQKAVVLRKSDRKMSRQCDLCQWLGVLSGDWNPRKHKLKWMLLECQEMRLQYCEINSKEQGMFVLDKALSTCYNSKKDHIRDEMVWAEFSIGGCTELYIFRKGNLIAQSYIDKILRPYAAPCASAIGDSFLLMQNNV
ncbi:hypothetical protein TNCV_67521 [Trichonephila clavipes]|nr:hypothetical protein TNCV_67521 [Trichonephila clavipes]